MKKRLFMGHSFSDGGSVGLFSLLFLSFALTSFNAYPMECVPADPDASTEEAAGQTGTESEALAAARAKVDEAKAKVDQIKAEADQSYKSLVDKKGRARAAFYWWWNHKGKIQQAELDQRKAEKESYRQQLIDSGCSRAGAAVRMFWKYDKGILLLPVAAFFLYAAAQKNERNSFTEMNLEDFPKPVCCFNQTETGVDFQTSDGKDSTVVVFDPNKLSCSRFVNGDVSCPYLGIVHIFPKLCLSDISDVVCDRKVKEKIVKFAGYGVFLPFDKRDFHFCADKDDGTIQYCKLPENDKLICSRYNPKNRIVILVEIKINLDFRKMCEQLTYEELLPQHDKTLEPVIQAFKVIKEIDDIVSREMEKTTVVDEINTPFLFNLLNKLQHQFILDKRMVEFVRGNHKLPLLDSFKTGVPGGEIVMYLKGSSSIPEESRGICDEGLMNGFFISNFTLNFKVGKEIVLCRPSFVMHTIGHEISHSTEPLRVELTSPAKYLLNSIEIRADLLSSLVLMEVDLDHALNNMKVLRQSRSFSFSSVSDFCSKVEENPLQTNPHAHPRVVAYFKEVWARAYEQMTQDLDHRIEQLSDK
jgi:hypothetical protein